MPRRKNSSTTMRNPRPSFSNDNDSKQNPDFIEYVYCWLATDRLGGFILLGVSSEAGTHEQINQQEHSFREQSTEIVEALSGKYPQSQELVINYFNFELHMARPSVPKNRVESVFTGFQRLVTATEDTGSTNRIETQYFGPAMVHSSPKKARCRRRGRPHKSVFPENLRQRRVFCDL